MVNQGGKQRMTKSFSNTSGPLKGHKLLDKNLSGTPIIKANSLSPALLAGLFALNSFIKIGLTLSV